MVLNDLERLEGDPFISTGKRRCIISPYYIYIIDEYTPPFLLNEYLIKIFYSNLFNIYV